MPLKPFAADLHLHTALSPCAAEEMTPPAIVRAALGAGLSMIAVCDHNTAGNAAAVQEAAARAAAVGQGRLVVLAGMEIMTAEEVHVVGLFPDAASAEAAAAEVLPTLPMQRGRPSRFGRQTLMDADGRAVGREKRMLASASTFDLSASVDVIKRHGGVAVAAHVDRPSFSVTSQLGVFPEDVAFDALEISAFTLGTPKEIFFRSLGLPVWVSSDAHSLEEIGAAQTVLTAAVATPAELILAARENGAKGVARA